MANASVLGKPLFTDLPYIPPLDREYIVFQLWGVSKSSLTIQRFDTYFNFYINVCASQIDSEHALRTHQDLIDLTQFMKQESSSTKSQIRDSLSSGSFSTSDNIQIDRSIELALRLWLMVSTGDENQFIPGQTLLSWHDNESFVTAISRRFPKATNTQLGKFGLSPALTARNLALLGGFPIKWTCNLVDHLLLKNGLLHICHPVAVFQALETSPYLPQGLAEETLRALAVLFPWADSKAHDWLEKLRSNPKERTEFIDPGIGNLKTASLEIESFGYWRDRLEALENAFDKAEPGTLWQWWYDRRNRREWATFWVAFLVLVLTILFGLIQSVTGIIQVVYAVKAYNKS